MRDKLNILINNLSEVDRKKRIEAVKNLVDKYKENKDLQNEIILSLLKGIGSLVDNKKHGFVQTLHCILESMDMETLSSTFSQIKEHLFNKDSLKLKNKLGALLSIDAIISAVEISKIDKSNLTYFYDFVLTLTKDHSLGFLSAITTIKFMKKIPGKELQPFLKKIPSSVFEVDNLDNCPQNLIFCLYFSMEHKKTMKNFSISIPSIQSKPILDKLPKLFRMFKGDQLTSVLHLMGMNPSFSMVWKSFIESLSSDQASIKLKKVILLLSFKVMFIQNNENNALGNLSNQNKIMKEMWADGIVLDLLLKQLSRKDFELHGICQEFVMELNKFEVTEQNQKLLEDFFRLICEQRTVEFVTKEANISQSLRLSQALLRHVKSTELYNLYKSALIEHFQSSSTYQAKVYGLEQLSTVFVKCSVADESIVEMLMKQNHEYNHIEVEKTQESLPVESARSALFRCLQEVALSKNSDRLKSLLTRCSNDIYQNEELKAIADKVLKYWTKKVEKPKSKKRRASECNIDVVNIKVHDMFVSLLSHLCFYMTTQPFDDELVTVVQDVMTCFEKSNSGVTDGHSTSANKRLKLDDQENRNERERDRETWTIVFTDVIVALLEQNCHYLRNLLVNCFRTLVEEGFCDSEVIEHINSIIEKAEIQSRDVGKKNSMNDEEDDDDEEEEEEKDEQEDSDNKEDKEVDDSSDDDEDDEAMDVDDQENDLKARIFAALQTVKADVNSDSDDNCPEVAESESESNDDQDHGVMLRKPKTSLKEQRYIALQLKQFKNRCIDLLETVFLHSPKFADRMFAFSSLMIRLQKSDVSVETRMTRLSSSFKKFQKTQDAAVSDVVPNLERLMKSVEMCSGSKNVLKLFGNILITVLRLNKSEMTTIVEYFKPIIDSLVMKKNHTLKPVFLVIFDQCPEVILAFHDQLLAYVCADDSKQCSNYQVIGILRKILTSQSIKNCVQGTDSEEVLIKSEIENFVNKFGSLIAKLIGENETLKDHPKNFAMLINCLIDCLKLMGAAFYQALDQNIVEKIKSIPRNSMPKDFKKVVNQFVSAVNFAKSSKNV